MICEIIKKPGEKGSGGGVEAFKPGVRYGMEKAAAVRTRNVTGTNWEEISDEMILTAELNDRVQKPYYHMVLSWHEHEQPTEEQMFEAADHMINSLGLEEHQIVQAIHLDTKRRHIHLIANTVNPVTGKVWSKSQDHMRAEKACREIELAQGWSHDRGRFDFDVKADGTVELKPNPEAWSKKQADRETGKRPKTSGARKREKTIGIESFEDSILDAMKNRFAEAVGTAYDWQTLHTSLGEIGLCYYKHGSGARVGILGSEEFAKASAFGSKFSIAKMEKSLGPYQEPESVYQSDLKEDHEDNYIAHGIISDKDFTITKATSFKMTLLRRIYSDLFLDPSVSKEIKYVHIKDIPPQITFRDRSTIVDYGDRLSTSKSTKETRAAMIAMAKAKGWSSVQFTGSPEFVRQASLEAAQSGLPVHGAPDDIQAQCDAIIERLGHQQRRIEAEAKATQDVAHAAVAARDKAVSESDQERTEKAAHEREITAEARAVIEALGSGRDPIRTAFRTVAREEEKRIKAELPDRRTVSNPQPAPDADRGERGRTRRIAKTFRENDATELDRMRAVHIDEIAARGGWSYNRKHKDRHNDPLGRDRRTYTRGDDTIKATRKGDVWVWVNNKSGESGSVIDLWLADNSDKTLGDARQAFREILGTDIPMPAPTATSSQKDSQKDHTAARKRWEEAPYIESQRTYAEDRGISKSTLRHFHDQVRCGAFGGIYFAHRNLETGDIQGFEQRWEQDGQKNQARFAKGGLKTVSILGNRDTASRMIVLEGGLDALALAEIEARDDTIYVSTGGGFGPRTEAALLKLAKGREVLSGFDNDKAGQTLAAKLKGFLPTVKRYPPPSRIEGSKTGCKDWLDVLNAIKARRPAEAAIAIPIAPSPPAMPEDGGPVGKEGLDDALETLRKAEEDFSVEQPEDESDRPGFP